MSGAYVYVRRSLGAVEIRVWNKTSWFLKGHTPDGFTSLCTPYNPYRVVTCVWVLTYWEGGSGVQVAHPRHRAGACTLNAVGLLPVSRAWRCEGRPPLPHHFVCVETFTLPYLTLPVLPTSW